MSNESLYAVLTFLGFVGPLDLFGGRYANLPPARWWAALLGCAALGALGLAGALGVLP